MSARDHGRSARHHGPRLDGIDAIVPIPRCSRTRSALERRQSGRARTVTVAWPTAPTCARQPSSSSTARRNIRRCCQSRRPSAVRGVRRQRPDFAPVLLDRLVAHRWSRRRQRSALCDRRRAGCGRIAWPFRNATSTRLVKPLQLNSLPGQGRMSGRRSVRRRCVRWRCAATCGCAALLNSEKPAPSFSSRPVPRPVRGAGERDHHGARPTPRASGCWRAMPMA